ncbi:MAG TPA: hypothetical protein VMU17_06025 [Elusimicrobiota bacterium]|nr:hypothetical protein [Elusimicrobiota bacterium]
MSRLCASRQEGQIALPLMMLVFVLGLFFVWYLHWCRALYWQMRVDMAADAAAISAARAEAETLNNLVVQNDAVNLLIQKVRAPATDAMVGFTTGDKIPLIQASTMGLKASLFAFKTVPAGVGATVAQLNGCKGTPLYWPVPSDPYLVPQRVHGIVAIDVPPFVLYRDFDSAYLARAWSPSKQKAQPPHRTTWLVTQNGFRGIATARLWLDTPVSAYHTGGFPPVRGAWWADMGIQSIPPHFNARLQAEPAISIDRLMDVLRRLGKPV